ncbi:hypothetical protein [Streptomyces sp. NPDC127119]|uniref:hypothetical protein n=1 Tax=Streptomyces sp. NPDC127119 TaxID=3345370 RepID=UPI00363D5C05
MLRSRQRSISHGSHGPVVSAISVSPPDLGMPTFADVAIRTTTTSTDQHRP